MSKYFDEESGKYKDTYTILAGDITEVEEPVDVVVEIATSNGYINFEESLQLGLRVHINGNIGVCQEL